jgi:hypothetical protein
MTTINVHRVIEHDFNSAQDLIDIYSKSCYYGFVLGVSYGNKLATVEMKKQYKGYRGWVISYGIRGSFAKVLESKATSPKQFKEVTLCREGYQIKVKQD